MNEFIGKIGERALWFAKVVEKKDVNTHYGASTVYSVVTKTGRYGSFFADNNDQLDVDVTKKISSEIEKAKSEVDSLTGSIKRDL